MKHLIRRCLTAPVSIIALVAGTACQRYVELGVSTPPANSDVRLTLSESGGDVPYGPIGSSLRQIEGRTMTVSDSSIRLSVTGVTRKTGFDESWSGEPVAVPRGYIVSVESRTLSVPRTLATIGAFIAGTFVVKGAFTGGESTNNGVNKPGAHN